MAKVGAVPLLEVRTKHSTTYFLERKFESQLERLKAEECTKKAAYIDAPNRREEDLKRLEAYLSEKISSGHRLPVGPRGNLNKSVIAKVCAFDRFRLYEDEDFKRVLRTAAMHFGHSV